MGNGIEEIGVQRVLDTAMAYYVVMPAPSFQAQLDRIEGMLKELTSLPHNKRDPLFQGPPPSAPDQKHQQIDGHVWAPRPPK